jgi:hypothetical protein
MSLANMYKNIYITVTRGRSKVHLNKQGKDLVALMIEDDNEPVHAILSHTTQDALDLYNALGAALRHLKNEKKGKIPKSTKIA